MSIKAEPVTEPVTRRVFRAGNKDRRGRINLPFNWVGKEVVVAPDDSYVVISKEEYERMKRVLNNSSVLMKLFEKLLNTTNGNKMFSVVSKTWNPVTGCLHGCKYCWARKLAETKLKNSHRYKRGFIPRINEKEFNVKFNEGDFIFVSDMGDLFGSFIPREWILRVLAYVKKFPETYFLFLTKNPSRYTEFIEEFPENVILGITIETNKDDLYLEYGISGAPVPSVRYESFKKLDWNKKFISIEPILDFDLEIFWRWIDEIRPIMTYIGYDNYNHRLPEPALSKTLKFIEKLREITLVVKKTIRPAWNEVLNKHLGEVEEV